MRAETEGVRGRKWQSASNAGWVSGECGNSRYVNGNEGENIRERKGGIDEGGLPIESGKNGMDGSTSVI